MITKRVRVITGFIGSMHELQRKLDDSFAPNWQLPVVLIVTSVPEFARGRNVVFIRCGLVPWRTSLKYQHRACRSN